MTMYASTLLSILQVSGILIINVAAVAFCFIFMSFCINYNFCVDASTVRRRTIMCQCHNLTVISKKML